MHKRIPRIIHYCWFGRKTPSRLAGECLRSWRQAAGDFQVKLWNEDNCDLGLNRYVEQAYAAGKFAFVSDYFRLLALYREGGVYLDTDVELRHGLEPFLGHSSFLGFESANSLGTAIMGAAAGSDWLRRCLDHYADRDFALPDGGFDTTPNVKMITRIMVEAGLKIDGRRQSLAGDIQIYPKLVFFPDREDLREPKSGAAAAEREAPTGCAIHHCEGSWMTFGQRLRALWFELRGRARALCNSHKDQ